MLKQSKAFEMDSTPGGPLSPEADIEKLEERASNLRKVVFFELYTYIGEILWF